MDVNETAIPSYKEALQMLAARARRGFCDSNRRA